MALFARHETHDDDGNGDDDGPGTVRRLKVYISAHITDQEAIEHSLEVVVPPDYDVADIRALTVRKIEDAAFGLADREFGRMPSKRALIAAAARLKGLERALDQLPRRPEFAEHIARMRMLFDYTNDQVITVWGDDSDPEGGQWGEGGDPEG